MMDLEALKSDLMARIDAAGDVASAGRHPRFRPRQERRDHRADETARRPRPRSAQGGRTGAERVEGREIAGALDAKKGPALPMRS